jgi:hypothetical protein
MKTSQDRILTTHVGSLPRPPELRQLLMRKDQGEPYDKEELARVARQAVVDIVRRQAVTGIDIVNDGEMSGRCVRPHSHVGRHRRMPIWTSGSELKLTSRLRALQSAEKT